MPLIELPRALEDYFAFAETEPTRRGRRFSITLPCHNGAKLERLQWWYHVSAAEELMFEGNGLPVLRARGIERFRRHIERWLEINRLRLHGEEPIPRLSSQQPLPMPVNEGQASSARQAETAAQASQRSKAPSQTLVASTAHGIEPRELTLPAWLLVEAANG
jgi:hypothetical protein